ncbi:MAG: polysaccharide biosynthesis C-terminal domain-containing protein, partial [Candidatus Omnitrophica bacterium]|nr:polysaccharide biosynthesis C-terminal domain-containing protein [Candidatus Omnitrophota bacterium]
VAGLCLVVNVTLNFVLMGPLKVGGIALASSIASGVNFFILFNILSGRLKGIGAGLLDYVTKIFLSSLFMGEVCFLAWKYLPFSSELLKLVIVIIVGVVSFFQICFLFKVQQAERLFRWVSQRV